jgi:tRNA modification GTPase
VLAGSSSLLAIDDTIAAIASAPGGGVRGIVRISGADCLRIASQIFNSPAAQLSQLRVATCLEGELRLPPPIGMLPARLLVWPTSRSYTRQPTAELHTLGSPPILQATLQAVCRAGARVAGPGEFTLRAFLAGRIDLPQAEAVLGVIDAQDQLALQTALAQLAGNLSRPLAALRERLLDLLSHLEAGLDFVEEDIEFVSREELASELASALAELQAVEAKMHSRGTANELPRVALLGAPNAGKSSLFNSLVQADAALVSPQAGTTRDYVSRIARFEGLDCLLVDTAGLDDSPGDEIQVAAQALSQRSHKQADLSLWCCDATRPIVRPPPEFDPARTLCVLTKWDQAKIDEVPPGWLRTSAHTCFGITDLRQAIAASFIDQKRGEVVPATSVRCRLSLQGAHKALSEAQAALVAGTGEEVVAAELRLALDELGQVVGAVYTDDILDRVFSRFCIGK